MLDVYNGLRMGLTADQKRLYFYEFGQGNIRLGLRCSITMCLVICPLLPWLPPTPPAVPGQTGLRPAEANRQLRGPGKFV